VTDTSSATIFSAGTATRNEPVFIDGPIKSLLSDNPTLVVVDPVTNPSIDLTRTGRLVILLVPFAQDVAPREMSRALVHIDDVARTASGVVGIMAIASLVISATSKFDLINPFFAILSLIAAGSFWMMTVMAKRRDKQNHSDK
jgi:hypothetical protein